MNIIELELEDCFTVLLRINWLALVISLILASFVPIVFKRINNSLNKKSMEINSFLQSTPIYAYSLNEHTF